MKKFVLFLLIASVVLFTSCGGAAVGAVLGGTLGSAIGGVSSGPRGHDVGLLVGAVGGAMVGAAIETSAEQQAAKQKASDQQKYQQEKARLAANREARQQASASANTHDYDNDPSGYDPTHSGDDRVDIDFGDDSSNVESVTIEELPDADDGPSIEIRNVRFVDSDGTNTITRGEQCSIVFEIYNAGNSTAYDIEPSVTESRGNSHITISPSILVESLAANKGIRYTARLVADNSLRDGTAYFTIDVTENGKRVGDGVTFSIPTSKN